jgi:hypothetical protein
MAKKITSFTEPKETNPGGSALPKHNISAAELNDIRDTVDSHADDIDGLTSGSNKAIRNASDSPYPYDYVWTGTQAQYDARASHPSNIRFDILDV